MRSAVKARKAATPRTKRESVEVRAAVEPTPSHAAIDSALNCQRANLFQVLGIVRMAAQAIREPGYKHSETDAWGALDAAAGLLGLILDRLENLETLVAKEVRRGEY